METNLETRLQTIEAKLDAVYVSAEKTRKYLLIIMWSSVAMIVLPLLLALIVVPIMINTLTSSLEGLI